MIANALHIMPKPDEALKEIKRVLKLEGIFIAPTFVKEDMMNDQINLKEYLYLLKISVNINNRVVRL